jgi:DNA repair exonuclease SbcCD ATPase subunit
VIHFKSVSWKNFLSTGNSPNKVQLNRSTTTLIIGKNGEGKSTILDALCFGLFGKPFRDIKKNQLINSINQKQCMVEVEFSIGSNDYLIKRGIKPNVFEIYTNGQLMNQDAASRDYQKVLEQQILKLNYKTFTQVVILGSASFVPFMQLPSSQRREVIEDILDIKIFSTMNQLLKERINATKDELRTIESSIEVAKNKVASQKRIIETLEESKKDALDAIKKKIQEHQDAIAKGSLKATELFANINVLLSSISDSDEVESQITKAKTAMDRKQTRKSDLSEKVQFFNDSDVCPSCQQGIPHEHKNNIVQDLIEDMDRHTHDLHVIEEALSKLSARMKEINEVNKQITAKNIELSTTNSSITLYNNMIKDLEEQLTESKTDTSNIDEEKAKLKEIAAEAMSKIERKKELTDVRSFEEIAAVLLRDNGIKTAIIKEYLPVMNKLINSYLQAMDFYVHFELDEAFNETIKSRYRDEFTYASFSEGEKMRIDLAILFTWRQIAKMKNSVNTNLLILDEIFDSSLDVSGTDYFLQVMNTLGDKSNVFVISHKGDQLFDKFRSVIKFEKRNDFSVIVGA